MASSLNNDKEKYAQEMLAYINSSQSPFHAVDEAKKILLSNGFKHISENEPWHLSKGEKYFFTRNYSSIIAFAIGDNYTPGNGFEIIAAHTDSPCLKLKPISKITKGGFLQVDVQTYGGGIWHTWFNRDLSIAGRVIVRKISSNDEKGELAVEKEVKKEKEQEQEKSYVYSHCLVNIPKPILCIPSLAIHLNRDVNSAGFKLNEQTHLIPILSSIIKESLNKTVASKISDNEDPKPNNTSEKTQDSDAYAHHPLLLKLIADQLKCEIEEIVDFEMCLYDTQLGIIGGALDEFVFSARLDNLCMSFCALKALVLSTTDKNSMQDYGNVRMISLFDHEEIGSNSFHGASSPFLLDSIKRINSSFYTSPPVPSSLSSPSFEEIIQLTISKSFIVSADMAHCLHPNYMEKHEENHQPKMHKGLVIKTNANQRYATNSVTSFLFKEIAFRHNLPTQEFVVRNDMPCGSTIGPILSSGIGIRTIDVGIAQFAMHSIREMCGTEDVDYAITHFTLFFEHFSRLDAQLKVDVQ